MLQKPGQALVVPITWPNPDFTYLHVLGILQGCPNSWLLKNFLISASYSAELLDLFYLETDWTISHKTLWQLWFCGSSKILKFSVDCFVCISFQTCYICEERGRESKTAHGACMNCNKTGCRHAFHVTWWVILFMLWTIMHSLVFHWELVTGVDEVPCNRQKYCWTIWETLVEKLKLLMEKLFTGSEITGSCRNLGTL